MEKFSGVRTGKMNYYIYKIFGVMLVHQNRKIFAISFLMPVLSPPVPFSNIFSGSPILYCESGIQGS